MPVWPTDLSEDYNNHKVAIDVICDELLLIRIPKPVTPVNLSKSPGSYLPMLAHILKVNERQHQQQQDQQQQDQQQQDQQQQAQQQLPRLFSLCPQPSFKWRFITVNPNCLAALAGIKLATDYKGKLNMFNKVFDFKKLKIDRY